MRPNERWLVASSVRTYRLLCRAYPSAFRARFGRDMELDFAELCRDALASRSKWALARVWIGAILDLGVNAAIVWTGELAGATRATISSAAYTLMLVVTPVLLLARTFADSRAVDVHLQRLSALALHCVLMIVVALLLRRRIQATIGIACGVVTLLGLDAARLAQSANLAQLFPSALLFELRISVPVAVVLLLVHLLPIPPAATLPVRPKTVAR